jgi:hypothetical protein
MRGMHAMMRADIGPIHGKGPCKQPFDCSFEFDEGYYSFFSWGLGGAMAHSQGSLHSRRSRSPSFLPAKATKYLCSSTLTSIVKIQRI